MVLAPRRGRGRLRLAARTTATLADGPLHLRGARDRRGRQHRPDAGDAAASRSTPTAPQTTIDARPSGPINGRHADVRVHRRASRARPSSAGSTTARFDAVHVAARRSAALARRSAHLRGARDRPGRATPTRRPRAAASRSTRRRRRRRSTRARRARRRTRRRRSRSPPARPARRFECRVDAGAFAAVHVAADATRRSRDGAHTFEVRATDAAGNTDPTPASRTLHGRHDRAARRRSTAGPSGPTDDATPTFEFSATSPARRSSAASTLGAVRGVHARRSTLRPPRRRRAHLRGARDRRGRQHRREPASRTLHGRHDRAGDDDRLPGPSSTTDDATPTFDVLRRRAGLDASSAGSIRSASTSARARRRTRSAALSDGAHTLRGARDRRGRQRDPTPADAHASRSTPTAPRDDDRRAARRARPTTPRRRSSSPPASPARRSSAGSTTARLAACTSPHTYAPRWPTARTRFEVRATDAAGNTDPTPADAHASPSTRPRRRRRSTRGPTGHDRRRHADVRVLVGEPGSTVRVPRRRPAAFATCASPHTTRGAGRRRAHVRGARRPTRPATPTRRPRPARFTVDTTAPETTIDSRPTGPTNDTTPTFEFSGTSRARRSSAGSTTARFAACASPARPTRAGDGDAHLRGARDRRSRQHRPDARHAARSRSTRAAPRDDDRRRRRRADQRRRRRRSSSPPARPARPSSAASTRRAVTRPARSPHGYGGAGRRPAHASRCARPTRPATPTRRPRRARFTVDTTAPRHDDRLAARRADQRRDADVRVQLDEAGATFECRVDARRVREPARRRRRTAA